LDDQWRFLRANAAGAESSQFDDSSWEWVTLPHTYNAKDGELGGPYYRGTVWYRRALLLTKYDAARRYFLQFDGAALVTDVWVNDRHAGRHEGGYAGFRFDVGNLLHEGRNVIAVRVDNSRLRSIAPLGGDFTVFGGLYRRVQLLSTDALHIDLLDHGGPGVYAAATDISEDRASLTGPDTGVLRSARPARSVAQTPLSNRGYRCGPGIAGRATHQVAASTSLGRYAGSVSLQRHRRDSQSVAAGFTDHGHRVGTAGDTVDCSRCRARLPSQ
jgi:hypothetical protein